jgi:hypothetical protein
MVMGFNLASFNETGEIEEEFNLLGLGTLEQLL